MVKVTGLLIIIIIWNMPTGGTILKYKALVVDYVLSNTVQELSNCTTICHTVYIKSESTLAFSFGVRAQTEMKI